MMASSTIIGGFGHGSWVLVLGAAATFALTMIAGAQTPNQPSPQFFQVELLGIRAGWPENMTADEERIMGEHFTYLKQLTAKNTVLMAGPVIGRFGLVVLKVQSEEEARAIMDKEPSVAQGVHTYRLTPMVVSLLADSQRRERWPLEFSDREIYREATVKASLKDVWDAWTTTEGVQKFFSPDARIELRPGGPYEIYFDKAAPPGQRGGEGNKVLSFLPMQMLSFDWNAPPSFGPLRDVRTRIVIFFQAKSADSVTVEFHHVGWGTGPEWDAIFDYFDRAWTLVFENFEKRFTSGPLSWEE